MQGVLVFNTVSDAIRAGFQIIDRNADGYLARCKTERGWAMALIDLRSCPR
jgi:hypothetical protein